MVKHHFKISWNWKRKKYNLKSNYLGTSFVKNDFDIENSTKFLEKKKMEGNEII